MMRILRKLNIIFGSNNYEYSKSPAENPSKTCLQGLVVQIQWIHLFQALGDLADVSRKTTDGNIHWRGKGGGIFERVRLWQ
ncbi:hypothetical protein D5R40_32245 [Okeania hirsuta]|uniref:Uncharacterized protein n=1 Tax=Okeania hirsuta TaxID=1458930 RepID=A0A3N6QU56_9CYAN|nr:hypothetical protein D5R40_32245 [Okeania hirsuta]